MRSRVRSHLAEVSFWNIQRDHTARSHVDEWQFSHTFEPVTQGRGRR
jgi:hypothetical protein